LDELAFGMANELIEKPENKIAKKAECLHDCRWLMVGRGGDAVVAVEGGRPKTHVPVYGLIMMDGKHFWCSVPTNEALPSATDQTHSTRRPRIISTLQGTQAETKEIVKGAWNGRGFGGLSRSNKKSCGMWHCHLSLACRGC